MPEKKIKITISIELNDIKKALKERKIIVNKANINKFLDLIKQPILSVKPEFYDTITKDKETLVMYGFTFDKCNS